MFNKLFKKIDQIKEEVLDQASKHMSDVSHNAREGVGDAINEKKSDIFSSLLSKVTDAASTSANYLAQVEKMGNEKRASELGISSRELQGLSLEQIAAKYGMSVEEYQEKISKEAKQYDSPSLATSVKTLKERSEIELKARENQANALGMSVEEFDELTLQEQADKLDISLDELLSQRGLKF